MVWFENNAEVISDEGDIVCTLDRVVIDPKIKDVTHLDVSEGFLSEYESAARFLRR